MATQWASVWRGADRPWRPHTIADATVDRNSSRGAGFSPMRGLLAPFALPEAAALPGAAGEERSSGGEALRLLVGRMDRR